DGRFSIPLPPLAYSALLFDNDQDAQTELGYVNSVQFRDERLADAFLAALGAPTASGIPTGPLPAPYLVSVTPSPDSLPIPERSTVSPLPLIEAVLADGTNAVNPASMTMTLDTVGVPATVTPGAGQTSIAFTPSNLLAELSIHTVRVDYHGADSTAYFTQW